MSKRKIYKTLIVAGILVFVLNPIVPVITETIKFYFDDEYYDTERHIAFTSDYRNRSHDDTVVRIMRVWGGYVILSYSSEFDPIAYEINDRSWWLCKKAFNNSNDDEFWNCFWDGYVR